ncbi:aldehyde dehydrogenase family protein [Larsenimonas rhizosphaerae]|uniref:Aldehyde dehydrogenase family protein n=1 Tax=Larsenimonas rhizosphaerae TaxID=2944682 RepID=A0AA41ZF50_9GAMM|nr:aldehyde dehydrogenase family protein [Larsenimonas rhizosphaerae]MCX2524132.1 aldehyde dehydrogenase family protein [Larsenimonas rhizosphaerae]
MSDVTFLCVQEPAQFIAGQWQTGEGGDPLVDVNPFDQSEVARLAPLSREQLDHAIESTARGRDVMRSMPPSERSRLLRDAADWLEARQEAFLTLSAMEAGSSRLKATFELGAAISELREAASFPGRMHGTLVPSSVPGKQSRVVREPMGALAVISPFNFPLNLSMRSVAAMLATGNSVLLKPDQRTYLTGGLLLAEMFQAVGLPADALNVVVGDAKMIGAAMTSHPVFAGVSFTGSTGVGQYIGIECARHFKKSSLELAGNNPMLVLSDADVEAAADAAVFGSLLHQGQICMSTNRVLVSRSLYEDVVTALEQRVRSIKAGNPLEDGVILGPLIDRRQADAAKQRIDSSVSQGARLICGGEQDGNLITPALLVDVKPEMPAAKEEMFGPCVTVLPFEDDDAVLAAANVEGGALSASVFTRRERGPIEQMLQAGMIHFNDQGVNDEPQTLFTGLGASGMGQHNGHWGLNAWTRERWISDQGDAYRQFPFPTQG